MKQIIILFAVSVFLGSCSLQKSASSASSSTTTQQSKNISYSGGDGTSMKEAIIITGANNSSEGIKAEYAYLNQKLGQRGKDWSLSSQSLLNKNGKKYDKLTVVLAEGNTKVDYYFDITDFFGKW